MALAKAQRRKVFHRQSIMMIRDLIRNQQMIPTEYYLLFSSSLLCVFAALRAKRRPCIQMKTNEEIMALAKAQRRNVFHRQRIMMIRDLIRNQQMIPTEYYLLFSPSLLCVFAALRAKRRPAFR